MSLPFGYVLSAPNKACVRQRVSVFNFSRNVSAASRLFCSLMDVSFKACQTSWNFGRSCVAAFRLAPIGRLTPQPVSGHHALLPGNQLPPLSEDAALPPALYRGQIRPDTDGACYVGCLKELSIGVVLWYRYSYGTDFDNSEIASHDRTKKDLVTRQCK